MPKPEPTTEEQWQLKRDRESRAARQAAVAFLVAILGALGLLVVYATGGNAQLEGVALFVAFGGVGTGLGIWVRRVIREPHVVEERYPMRSAQSERDSFEDEYRASLGEAVEGGRRRFLLRLVLGTGASLGLALLIPLRSLGPGPENELFSTGWTPGSRLVDDEGRPVRADQIIPDQVVTVFPEGAEGSADSQAILVGTRPGQLDMGALSEPTPPDMVVYSKICTHAGCPVGLYRAQVGELLCPCHQSTFDVNKGAKVLSGPTGRPLPQLPVEVDGEGFLVAISDFNEPVGPSFWNITDTPKRDGQATGGTRRKGSS